MKLLEKRKEGGPWPSQLEALACDACITVKPATVKLFKEGVRAKFVAALMDNIAARYL